MIVEAIRWLSIGFALCAAADPLITLPDGTQLQGSKEGHIATFRGFTALHFFTRQTDNLANPRRCPFCTATTKGTTMGTTQEVGQPKHI